MSYPYLGKEPLCGTPYKKDAQGIGSHQIGEEVFLNQLPSELVEAGYQQSWSYVAKDLMCVCKVLSGRFSLYLPVQYLIVCSSDNRQIERETLLNMGLLGFGYG